MIAINAETLAPDVFILRGLLNSMECRQVMDVANYAQMKQAKIAIGESGQGIRSSDMVSLDSPDPLLRSTDALLQNKIAIIQKWLRDYYQALFPHSETCTLLRYQEGQFYRRHVDNWLLESRLEEAEKGVPTRDVSIVGYLNEDFEGGETYFDRQEIKVKPEQGAVLVFPSFFTFPHQALPVTKGAKYAFTTWLFH